MFCSEFAYIYFGFKSSVSMRKVVGEHPFCVLICMNSYIFHIDFILFILFSYLTFDWVKEKGHKEKEEGERGK